MKPEATSSQADEVTQLSSHSFLGGSCPQCFLNLCITGTLFLVQEITISQLGFMLHAFRHSKSIFLGACIITWVSSQHCFLLLFVIYIEVRSQSTNCCTYILTLVTFLLSLVFFMVPVYLFWIFLFKLIMLELLIFLFLLIDFYDFQVYVFVNLSFFYFICN